VNNRSILCYYCFDGKGNAQVRVEEFDGRGKVVLVCRTTGTARLDGEGIIIRDRGAECPPPEPSYAPDIVTCTRTSSGTASCVIRGGDSVARTVLTYQGD
jgi:hypothetical protein